MNRSPLGAAGGDAGHKRHQMAQNMVYSGTAAAANRGKMKNISNFGETCCENFFCSGTISPPMALIWVKKPGKKVGFSEKPRNISNLELHLFYLP